MLYIKTIWTRTLQLWQIVPSIRQTCSESFIVQYLVICTLCNINFWNWHLLVQITVPTLTMYLTKILILKPSDRKAVQGKWLPVLFCLIKWMLWFHSENPGAWRWEVLFPQLCNALACRQVIQSQIHTAMCWTLQLKPGFTWLFHSWAGGMPLSDSQVLANI